MMSSNNNSNKMEIQIYKKVYSGSWIEWFL